MAEPPYNQLPEFPTKQEHVNVQGYPQEGSSPSQQGYPQQGVSPPRQGYPQQAVYPSQQGYPPSYPGNQQISVAPTTTVIERGGQVQPNDYLALSIIVMLCCCLPLGIVALIKSQEVGTRFRSGDMDGALESSKEAHTYAKIGLFIGIALHAIWVVCLIVYIIFIVNAVASASSYDYYYYK